MSEDHGRTPDRRQLRRPKEGRILGGVCAAIARYTGVDPVVVRLAVAVLAILSGGTALIGYVAGWVLIPPAGERRAPAPLRAETTAPAAAAGARDAWHTVGGDLRTLAGDLRPHGAAEQATPATEAGAGTGGGRGPIGSVDATLTAFGDRVRDPQVHADARRAAADLSTAVTASVDEIGRRGRRTEGGG